jgi:hypothetical protein
MSCENNRKKAFKKIGVSSDLEVTYQRHCRAPNLAQARQDRMATSADVEKMNRVELGAFIDRGHGSIDASHLAAQRYVGVPSFIGLKMARHAKKMSPNNGQRAMAEAAQDVKVIADHLRAKGGDNQAALDAACRLTTETGKETGKNMAIELGKRALKGGV